MKASLWTHKLPICDSYSRYLCKWNYSSSSSSVRVAAALAASWLEPNWWISYWVDWSGVVHFHNPIRFTIDHPSLVMMCIFLAPIIDTIVDHLRVYTRRPALANHVSVMVRCGTGVDVGRGAVIALLCFTLRPLRLRKVAQTLHIEVCSAFTRRKCVAFSLNSLIGFSRLQLTQTLVPS